MTKTYTTISEVIDIIIDVLGDFADDFDAEGIAREMTDFDSDGNMVADLDRDDFWHIAAQYAC